MYKIHEPVLAEESIAFLNISKNNSTESSGLNKNYIDCTLGSGGHSEKILQNIDVSSTLIAIDIDEEAIEFAKKRLEEYKDQILYVNKNFTDIKQIVSENNIENISGILIDLGVSTHQILSGYRGFSYMREGELDMRMGKGVGNDAKNILNSYPQEELQKIFREFGEIKSAQKLSQAIVEYRKDKKIQTTSELVGIIKNVFGGKNEKVSVKLSAQVFQALRIAVNNELESLKKVVRDAIDVLDVDGRLVIISYHSLEDRIVKNVFKEYSRSCICPDETPDCRCNHQQTINVLTRKVVMPTDEEISRNPKSRSAKLRACQIIRKVDK